MNLLVATHNPGKIREMNEILAGFGVRCLSLNEAGISEDVEETGATFTENAVLKAVYYAAATQLLTLADDSGLEVDALNGDPGVYSKRYGGETPPLYARLMGEIQDVPWVERTARFRCVVALANGSGLIGTAEGVCEGMIAFEPKGSGGFGYDPVFYLPEWGQTMAELTAEEKHRISHRGRALAAIFPLLRQVVDKE
ncbi:MAG: RdgB/HAM1 family non-canonical purine NTP pyrophosphatase [Anaerolineae bacterium]|nr:RdgB/HAM1 family non-canonical purine NTP pyrophosphatase [Anaerolineae bacterium]